MSSRGLFDQLLYMNIKIIIELLNAFCFSFIAAVFKIVYMFINEFLVKYSCCNTLYTFVFERTCFSIQVIDIYLGKMTINK